MIRLAGRVPNKITVACSGGPDSMVAIDFFVKGKKDVRVAHFDHKTSHSSDARSFVEKYCKDKGLELVIGELLSEKQKGQSPEEFWREHRLKWLHSLDGKVVTGHHLDDAVEWWVFTSINGNGRLIPYANNNIIRPFLLTKKSIIDRWVARNSVRHVSDPSNLDVKYARNRIRSNLIPEILKINPGIHKVVRKKIEMQIKNERLMMEMPVC